MDELTPTAKPNSGLWRAWIGIVVGTPLLGVVAVLVGSQIKSNEDALFALAAILALGCGIAHLVVSIMLANRIARQRPPEHRTGSLIGLLAGLIMGGWAVMFAMFFCGCLAALATQ